VNNFEKGKTKMIKHIKSLTSIISCTVILLILTNLNSLKAQPSLSISYDIYPYSHLVNPNKELINGNRNFEQDLQIRIATLRVKAGYGFVLAKDKTVLINEITFDRFDMDYKNWNKIQAGTKAQPAHVYAVKYNLMLQHLISQKWSMLAFITPGLASDFRTTVSKDDLSFETAIVFVRNLKPTLAIGLGLAYSRQFGEPIPLPVLALKWNNGKNMKASMILPVTFDFWYRINQRIDIGVVIGGDGNQYHGDPDRYNVKNPQLRYSTFTLGPTAKFKLTPIVSFNLDGGYTFLRRFEYYDGNDKDRTLDLNKSGFVRIGFSIGG